MSRVRTHGAALARLGCACRSEPRGFRTAPGRAVWRRTERDLQVVEEESVVFSNIEVRVKRKGEPEVVGRGSGSYPVEEHY